MTRITVKTLVLIKNGKRRVVKIRERKNLAESLQACSSIAKHCRMNIEQIRYR